MFNTTNNSSSFNFNSVAGTLIKSHPLSIFTRCHMESPITSAVFDRHPTLYKESIVVLQVMLCGDKQFLVECIMKSDYDKQFESQGDDNEE